MPNWKAKEQRCGHKFCSESRLHMIACLYSRALSFAFYDVVSVDENDVVFSGGSLLEDVCQLPLFYSALFFLLAISEDGKKLLNLCTFSF